MYTVLCSSLCRVSASYGCVTWTAGFLATTAAGKLLGKALRHIYLSMECGPGFYGQNTTAITAITHNTPTTLRAGMYYVCKTSMIFSNNSI